MGNGELFGHAGKMFGIPYCDTSHLPKITDAPASRSL